MWKCCEWRVWSPPLRYGRIGQNVKMHKKLKPLDTVSAKDVGTSFDRAYIVDRRYLWYFAHITPRTRGLEKLIIKKNVRIKISHTLGQQHVNFYRSWIAKDGRKSNIVRTQLQLSMLWNCKVTISQNFNTCLIIMKY